MKRSIYIGVVFGLLSAQTRIDYKTQVGSIPAVLKVERAVCVGSGDSLDAQGQKIPYLDPITGQQKKDAQGNLLWVQYDCSGLELLKIHLADGSVRIFTAISETSVPGDPTKITWVDTPLTPGSVTLKKPTKPLEVMKF